MLCIRCSKDARNRHCTYHRLSEVPRNNRSNAWEPLSQQQTGPSGFGLNFTAQAFQERPRYTGEQKSLSIHVVQFTLPTVYLRPRSANQHFSIHVVQFTLSKVYLRPRSANQHFSIHVVQFTLPTVYLRPRSVTPYDWWVVNCNRLTKKRSWLYEGTIHKSAWNESSNQRRTLRRPMCRPRREPASFPNAPD
jgi:hypothetical protein